MFANAKLLSQQTKTKPIMVYDNLKINLKGVGKK